MRVGATKHPRTPGTDATRAHTGDGVVDTPQRKTPPGVGPAACVVWAAFAAPDHASALSASALSAVAAASAFAAAAAAMRAITVCEWVRPSNVTHSAEPTTP